MAATNYTPIQLYRSTTASAVPSAGNLAAGELAINLTDEKLYFKNAGGTVKLLADANATVGSVTSVNVSGGTTGLTTSGGPITSSGTITIAGTLNVANGGTGTTTSTGSGSVVLSTSPELATPTFTGMKEVRNAISASAIDLTLGNYFSKTITTTTTFTISNTPTTGTAASFILDLTNGGSATVNWWTGVKWAGGTAPTLTASGRDVLGFYTYDGGTTWSGFVLGLDVK